MRPGFKGTSFAFNSDNPESIRVGLQTDPAGNLVTADAEEYWAKRDMGLTQHKVVPW